MSMRSRRMQIFVCIFCGFLSGCWSGLTLPVMVDAWLFRQTGATLFSNPEALSLKEIHLDNGTLSGREVVVAGVIEDVSGFGTYLVMSDQSARLLVVLTEVEHVPTFEASQHQGVQVLGTIESGKKGLPVVKAVAIRRLESQGAGGGQAPKSVN